MTKSNKDSSKKINQLKQNHIINKLVRDKIPEVIRDAGWTPITKRVKDEELHEILFRKLSEEHNELIESSDIHEVADIIEVCLAIAKFLGFSENEILRIVHEKRREKGGFDERIFLIEISQEDTV
jgi:predicted house-cleaning noncanonical NTP pyrophosphatase (MazG superfamily)